MKYKFVPKNCSLRFATVAIFPAALEAVCNGGEACGLPTDGGVPAVPLLLFSMYFFKVKHPFFQIWKKRNAVFQKFIFCFSKKGVPV